MESLKVIDNDTTHIKYNYRFKNYISKDKNILILSADIQNNGYNDDYDGYFDKLNDEVQIYDITETLIINSDSINEIPNNVLKFNNLKKLNVSGSRFWNLQLTQVPKSVETLIFIDHSNLPLYCLMEWRIL